MLRLPCRIYVYTNICGYNNIPILPMRRYTRRKTYTLRSRKYNILCSYVLKRSNLYLSDYLVCRLIWRLILIISAIRQLLMRYLRVVSRWAAYRLRIVNHKFVIWTFDITLATAMAIAIYISYIAHLKVLYNMQRKNLDYRETISKYILYNDASRNSIWRHFSHANLFIYCQLQKSSQAQEATLKVRGMFRNW